MLKRIKSSVIFNKLFEYVNEDRKLKLARYNKRIQKIFRINIIDYMRLSEKIIFGDINGIGEECNGYNLRKIYEGEFLKGKRNGKGKEYDKKEN